MIIGLGSDLIDIRRMEKTLERFGQKFIDRVFTDVEQMKSERRAERVASYAKRFAAKEACAKALGTGLRHGVFWRDMGVVNLADRPTDHEAHRWGGRSGCRSDHAQGHGSPDRAHDHGRVPGRPGGRHHQRCNQTVAVDGEHQVRLRVQVAALTQATHSASLGIDMNKPDHPAEASALSARSGSWPIDAEHVEHVAETPAPDAGWREHGAGKKEFLARSRQDDRLCAARSPA